MKLLALLVTFVLAAALTSGCSSSSDQAATGNAKPVPTDANGNQTDPTAKPADPATGTGSEGIRSVPPNSPGQR